MVFNHKKSVILICRSKYMKNIYPVFTLNGKIIDESDTVTYLGHIYTIILLTSVCRRSQTAGRNSCSIVSGDVSNCSYSPKTHPVTS